SKIYKCRAMPSLYTGSSAAPPAATSLAATRSLDRQAKTLNDELLLTVEALPRFLPLHWHTVKDLEKLLKEGGLDLPDKLLSNALRSVKDGERGWSKNKFSNKIYFCPGGNNKIFDSPKLQKREGPIQIIDDGYYTQFEFTSDQVRLPRRPETRRLAARASKATRLLPAPLILRRLVTRRLEELQRASEATRLRLQQPIH
ncbi:hypothetical protein THAOC_19187, partial [Thalassiosira oceanica]